MSFTSAVSAFFHSESSQSELAMGWNESRFYPIYLVYSLFYFFPLIFMGDTLATKSALWWFGVVGLYGLFVAIFFTLEHASLKWRFGLMVMISLMATLGVQLTLGTSAFFAYIPFFALLFFPLRLALFWLIVGVFCIAIAALLTSFEPYFWMPAAIVFTVNSFTAMLELRKRQLQCAMQNNAQLVERDRITRDLHDVTGHQLTAIALKAQLAQKMIQVERYQEAAAELAVLADLAANNRKAIRYAIEGHDVQDVQGAYHSLSKLLQEQGFEVSETGELPSVIPSAQYDLVAIYSEAMTNVLRHGSRGLVLSEHQQSPEGYHWRLVNNVSHGLGKDRTLREPKSGSTRGFEGVGLMSMRKRAENIGGSLDFKMMQQAAPHQAELILFLPTSILNDAH